MGPGDGLSLFPVHPASGFRMGAEHVAFEVNKTCACFIGGADKKAVDRDADCGDASGAETSLWIWEERRRISQPGLVSHCLKKTW